MVPVPPLRGGEVLPVHVNESLVHWIHSPNSLGEKAPLLINYSYFRKVSLDPNQDGNVLAGLIVSMGTTMDLGEFV